MTERLSGLAALAIMLAGVAWFAFPRDNWRRGHARWIARAVLGFVLPTLIALALLGRIDALWVMPPEFDALATMLPHYDGVEMLTALGMGVPLGLLLVWARIRWLRRRGRPMPRSIVAPAPLAARRTGEMVPAALTGIVAGIAEELPFRLALPLAVTLVGGGAWLGFALATAVFVALHRYQRWLGMLAVTLTSVVLIALYLSTRALWVAIVAHVAIDVMALAIRPWLARFGR